MDDDDDRKNVQLKAMVTGSQKRQWEKAARLARRSLSDWLRVTLDDAAAEQITQAEQQKPSRKT